MARKNNLEARLRRYDELLKGNPRKRESAADSKAFHKPGSCKK
jgi:hypothetical protein